MRKVILLVVTIVFIALLGSIVFWTKRHNCRGIYCLNGTNLNEYVLEEIYQDDQIAFRGLYKKGDMLLRLETHYNISQQSAQELSLGTIAKLKGLYESAPAPYPGEVSDEIRCDTSLSPKVHQAQNSLPLYVEIRLNDRLSYGVCDPKEASYKGLVTFMTCPKGNQYLQLEFITLEKTYGALEQEIYFTIGTLACRN